MEAIPKKCFNNWERNLIPMTKNSLKSLISAECPLEKRDFPTPLHSTANSKKLKSTPPHSLVWKSERKAEWVVSRTSTVSSTFVEKNSGDTEAKNSSSVSTRRSEKCGKCWTPAEPLIYSAYIKSCGYNESNDAASLEEAREVGDLQYGYCNYDNNFYDLVAHVDLCVA